MPKGYRQLSAEERDRLAELRGRGRSLREIALALGRSAGTVSRELKRNAGSITGGDYLPHAAQRKAEARRLNHVRPLLRDQTLRVYVRRQISRGWSPERIAGRWNLLHKAHVAHETIYRWVYTQAPELAVFLPRAHRQRLRLGHRLHKQKVSFLPSRTPLSERPKFIEKRRQPGHWEADLIMGRHRASALQILLERSSRFTRLRKLPGPIAVKVREAITSSLGRYPKPLRRSITYDNGRENVQHLRVNQVLGTKSYFCEPMQSWQKGSVENAAGLVRRRLPKKTDFANVSASQIRQTERWLNGLPRKCLGYKTSAEVFRRSVALTTRM